MIGEFLQAHNANEIVKEFDLSPFYLNALNKNQTLLEKLVSLIRFSFSSSPTQSISGKIRHFYDLHYLLTDEQCRSYTESDQFIDDFIVLFNHDKSIFNEPEGWKNKTISQSPLIINFETQWESLKTTYSTELQKVVFSKIPDPDTIIESVKPLLNKFLTIK